MSLSGKVNTANFLFCERKYVLFCIFKTIVCSNSCL